MEVRTQERAIVPISTGELVRRVKLSLEAKGRELGCLSVDVTGQETIQLSGTVSSFYLRQLAIATAKRVAGARYVSDGIQVKRLQTEKK